MTTATAPSAYPVAVAELLPVARDLAEKLGEVPSRNRLMRELNIGAPKASALREALASDPEPSAEDVTSEESPAEEASALPTGDGHPEPEAVRRPVAWPVLLLALPAFVAIWSGWVELGELSGFGVVHPLPGIVDQFRLNSAITLPIGVETYAAYALWVWLSGQVTGAARRFAKWSAIASLIVGAAGQVAYHLMAAYGVHVAPWWITTLVASLPVAVLGMGAALAHLVHANHH
ncbi:ABC transporter permease [Dactylosporangium sp. NPDC049140]|uniref:ABC transporter permease n=1 Tax=Dactylosporangium sp. NPDC049140 TaxID=3155647 RepID=UPI0033E90DF7